MKILIVYYLDDNFGDTLIRINFESLLKCVLKNLEIRNYDIRTMHLKSVDRNLVETSDIIFFSGGGLFGLSYLNFFDYLEEILNIAENEDIPVVFSSLGINNMDATPENEDRLMRLLEKKCIVAMSVRENRKLFEQYTENCTYQVEEAVDPATWTKYVYYEDINRIHKESDKIVCGINVVRGGLFADNNRDWKLSDELNYLCAIKEVLENNNIDYYFYTNGSFLDNNTLRYFAKLYDIPEEKLIYPHCSKDLVKTMALFDCVAAIRMHSSIIAYALDIPSVNLVWNDKIPFFYETTGRPEDAIPMEQWNADIVFHRLSELTGNEYAKDENVLMTVYHYLFKTVAKLNKVEGIVPFTFENVKNELISDNVSIDNDLTEYRFKINKAERRYLSHFIKNRELEKERAALKKELKTVKERYAKAEAQLNRINSHIAVKLYRKIKKFTT